MVYRIPHAAPQNQVPEARRGRAIGRFCHVCGTIYPLQRSRHTGKPMYGRDHIASPCAHEGDVFSSGEAWWDLAVEVLPEAVQAPDSLVAGTAGTAPAKGTQP